MDSHQWQSSNTGRPQGKISGTSQKTLAFHIKKWIQFFRLIFVVFACNNPNYFVFDLFKLEASVSMKFWVIIQLKIGKVFDVALNFLGGDAW